MKKIFLILLIIDSISLMGQEKSKYDAEWKSLMKRETPEWFQDAKLGIFIHWGVYSVPAYTSKGGYAEWYYRGYKNKESRLWKFHKKNFGEDFSYKDFAKLFKAELFDPAEWAEIFKQSGAKYVVLTSKHHDGYCLWPSEYRPEWNSVVTGPKRDLVEAVTKSVREAGLKMGLYYSLPEWTNPLYKWTYDDKSKVAKYVDEYMIPQFKELVNKYEPSLIFADGEWDHSYQEWRSEEIVAWLYNNEKINDDLIVNDRWGGNTRFKYGGYYATEYTEGMENTEFPWEECRGLGASFGYNRNESIHEYINTKELIHMFIRLVSNGGNLLLNVGPTADGRIPVIMQERLLQLGEWIKNNKRAIYGTRAWKYNSEGENIRYTASKDGKTINAICYNWPGSELNLKRVEPAAGSKIFMNGIEKPVDWKWDDKKGLIINLPAEYRDSFSVNESYAYSFSIKGKPSRIAGSPTFYLNDRETSESLIIIGETELEVSNGNDAGIYFSFNEKPGFNSAELDGSLNVNESAVLYAFAYEKGKVRSLNSKLNIIKKKPEDAVEIELKDNGLKYNYYEDTVYSIPDFENTTPKKSGVIDIPRLGEQLREDFFSFEFEGFFEADETEVYTFYLSSDDGSKLYIDGKLLIDHDGPHGMETKSAQIALKEGFHKIKIEYFEGGYDNDLKLEYSTPHMERKLIPGGKFFYE